MSTPVIGYCGMTHLGLNSAVASAARGFDTVCFDPDAGLIVDFDQGSLPVVEPQLDELFEQHRARLTFTADSADLQRCDLVYVAPDVPTDDEGKSDLSGICALLDVVEPALRDDAILVVLSQVNPGFTRERGRANGPLYYQVETLIFGRAIERALYPERYIVGCADSDAPLPDAYRTYLKAFDCPILPMRYESAELAKISINMCLVASINVANTMAEICENIGADWSEIVPSLRLDRRIGEFSYIVPGLGISGGNLERDLASVIRMADSHATDAGVVKAWIANSQHRKGWAYRTLKARLLDDQPNAKIGVLGLAYKENTHSIKNSPSIAFLEALAPHPATVFDPVVKAAPAERISYAESALDVCDGADVVMVLTPWPEFRELDVADIKDRMTGCLLIDPYCVLDAKAAQDVGLDYITLGVAPMQR